MQKKLPAEVSALALFIFVPVVLRAYFPERALDESGARALLDSFFGLWLALALFLLAGALGQKLLRPLTANLPAHEQCLFAIPIGLGALAYGVFALGLLGWLTPAAIASWLGTVLLFTWRECVQILMSLPAQWDQFRRSFLARPGLQKFSLAFAGVILLATLIQALGPLWDYDGLMYHMRGPHIFLQQQRIGFVPEIFQVNGPFSVEMLFTIGLAFGSTSAGKLMHVGYAVIFFAAAFAFAQRHFGFRIAWLAFIALLGAPFIPVAAGYANIDLAWATYEFLAVYALTIALTNSSPPVRLALLSALMAGLALGAKYLSLSTAALLGIWWLWSFRTRPVREIILLALTFGSTALVIAAPWYIKNYLFTGNPVYPFYLDSPDWGESRRALLMYYVNSFGMGPGLKNFLLLPFNMFAHFKYFGTLYLEMPSALFLLIFFFPWVARQTRIEFPHNILKACLPYVTLYALIWALGSQQVRFLLPIFPFLSVMAALVLDKIPAAYWGRLAVFGLVSSALISTLYGQVKLYSYAQALPPLLGLQSKNDFLRETIENQPAIEFLQATLKDGERMLMLWDGRNYYCEELCIPDNAQISAIDLSLPAGGAPDARIELVTARLHALGATHILVNEADRGWLIKYHDPLGLHLAAAIFLSQQYLPACAEKIYQAEYILVYRLTC